MKEKLNKWTAKLSILILALFLLALIALPAAGSSEYQQGVTGLNSLWLAGGGGTAVPALRVNQPGAGMAVEVLDGGTRVWGVTGGGKVIEGGVNCFRSNSTVTDTVSYTSTVTAISTPTYVDCSLRTLSGDAIACGITHGTGAVTITVRNAAATPAANAAGAVVNYEVCGTPN
jgi:hypothetical protein